MNHPRRNLTPGASSIINKRKFEFDAFKPSPPTKFSRPGSFKPGLPPPTPKPASEPASNNHLLAGYLAHEFLKKGTLFGEQWDPARAEAVPVSSAAAELKRAKRVEKPRPEPSEKPELKVEKHQRYVEVAGLMKTDGAHIAGIVNPTQLARFLQM